MYIMLSGLPPFWAGKVPRDAGEQHPTRPPPGAARQVLGQGRHLELGKASLEGVHHAEGLPPFWGLYAPAECFNNILMPRLARQGVLWDSVCELVQSDVLSSSLSSYLLHPVCSCSSSGRNLVHMLQDAAKQAEARLPLEEAL